jgi:hypothetical protein
MAVHPLDPSGVIPWQAASQWPLVQSKSPDAETPERAVAEPALLRQE